jgi:beta-galactosidase
VESLRPGVLETVNFAGQNFYASRWRETIETDLVPAARFSDGYGALFKHGRHCYLAAWPESDLCRAVMAELCTEAGIALIGLDDGLRLRRRGNLQFAFNYGPNPVQVPAPEQAGFILGGANIAPGDVAAWRIA